MLHRHSVSSFAFILRAVYAATKRRPDAVEAGRPRIDWAPPKASWECHLRIGPSRSTRFFAGFFLAFSTPPDCDRPSPHSKAFGKPRLLKRTAPSRRHSR